MPPAPCPGQTFKVQGENFGGASVQAYLERLRPEPTGDAVPTLMTSLGAIPIKARGALSFDIFAPTDLGTDILRLRIESETQMVSTVVAVRPNCSEVQ